MFMMAAMVAFVSASATPAAAPPAPKDKVVCKKFVETGSLVRSRRECRTRRDWNRLSNDAQDETNRLRPNVAVVPNG